MAPIRVRHPKGVSTINIDLDTATVLDLQQAIRAATEVLPSQQELKAGYPPQPLTLIPELPVSSLGLRKGDQLILTVTPDRSHRPSAPSQPINSQASRQERAPVASALSSAGPLTSLQSSSTSKKPAGAPEFARLIDGGVLIHRVVPDDNSCLFSAVGILFEQGTAEAAKLRKIVADAIEKDPETYNDAFLGRSRDDYQRTIFKPSSWGGAIELSIFSEHYRTEICSVDVETGRIDRYGEGKFDNRGILIYSGIHYDAATLSPELDLPTEFHQTVFPVDDEQILSAAAALATKLRAKRAFTNTSTFDLKCEQCGKGLKGEKEARAHASETGHTQFGEY